MLHHPPAIYQSLRPACTWYTDSSRRKCANGLTYQKNARKYHYFVANNHYRLGSCVPLSSRCGHARAYVVDRIGHGTEWDANTALARVLMGRGWRQIGRTTVYVGADQVGAARRKHHREAL